MFLLNRSMAFNVQMLLFAGRLSCIWRASRKHLDFAMPRQMKKMCIHRVAKAPRAIQNRKFMLNKAIIRRITNENRCDSHINVPIYI